MSILDILEAHTYHAHTTPHSMGYWARCACGWTSEGQQSHDYDFTPEHRGHVARVLEQHVLEAKAEALEEAAAEIERLENIGDTAQDELNEEQTAEYWLYHGTPKTTWLRDLAAQLKEAP